MEKPKTAEERQVHDARAIKEMVSTEGWAVLASKIEIISKAKVSKLIEETDSTKIACLQADIKALQAIVDIVSFLVGVNTD